MKALRLFAFPLLVIILGSAHAPKEVYLFTSFHEPATDGLRMLYSYDGYHWTDLDCALLKPEAGPGKLMRDPSMIKGPDGTFHLVWTTGWKGDQGFGYARSRDLIHWSPQKFVSVMAHEPATVNVWAPEIFYDDEREEFLIIWASTIPFRFSRGVEEEHNNHRMYYTTTKDFNTFSEARLFVDPGFSIIDAVIVKRSKADYVLVLKDNTRPNRNLKVAFSNDVFGPYTHASAPFTGNFIEGPTVVKLKDAWVIYYDAYKEKKYGAMKTKDFNTFEDITAQVVVPPGHKHGTILKTTETILERLKKETSARKTDN